MAFLFFNIKVVRTIENLTAQNSAVKMFIKDMGGISRNYFI